MHILHNKEMKPLTAAIFTGLLFVLACDDVPHDNPLDPVNGSSGITLSGKVSTFYQPRTEIRNAIVQLKPGNQVILSDEKGNFSFERIQSGQYTLYCEAEGFRADSALLNLSQDHTHVFYLDGMPFFKQIDLSTQHIARWFQPENLYFLDIRVAVDDPDGIGDINQVVYEIPNFAFLDTLMADIESGVFRKTVSIADLPVNSIHALIGHAFYFYVIDDFGSKNRSDEKYITRIIEQSPILRTPVELESVTSGAILFQWNTVSVPFDARLRIDLFQINSGIFERIDSVFPIQKDQIALLYENPVISGDYFWRLLIVDDFGNSSGSKEGVFTVINSN